MNKDSSEDILFGETERPLSGIIDHVILDIFLPSLKTVNLFALFFKVDNSKC